MLVSTTFVEHPLEIPTSAEVTLQLLVQLQGIDGDGPPRRVVRRCNEPLIVEFYGETAGDAQAIVAFEDTLGCVRERSVTNQDPQSTGRQVSLPNRRDPVDDAGDP